MRKLRAWSGVCLGVALMGLTAVGPGIAAPSKAGAAAKPPAAVKAPAAGGRVLRMTTLLAYEPTWLPDSKRLAFLGNRQEGEASHVYVWEPLTNTLGRASTGTAKRHSLTCSSDGRLAYVEHGDKPPVGQPGDASQPQPGPDTLIVQDLATTQTQQVLTNGWVLPRSVAWSPDGQRLAFITIDRSGQQRLAVVTPGQPVALVQLQHAYEFNGLVGWVNAREVLLSGTPLTAGGGGGEQLLLVGRDGVRAYRQALEPKLSPDGRWLLAKNSAAGGVTLRLVSGGARVLNPSAAAFDWAPEADRVYATVERDVLALDLRGKVLHRWAGLARLALGEVAVSPDGKLLAYMADYNLAVLTLK